MKNYFNQEINQRKLCSKKLSKYVAAFDYIDKVLIVLIFSDRNQNKENKRQIKKEKRLDFEFHRINLDAESFDIFVELVKYKIILLHQLNTWLKNQLKKKWRINLQKNY